MSTAEAALNVVAVLTLVGFLGSLAWMTVGVVRDELDPDRRSMRRFARARRSLARRL